MMGTWMNEDTRNLRIRAMTCSLISCFEKPFRRPPGIELGAARLHHSTGSGDATRKVPFPCISRSGGEQLGIFGMHDRRAARYPFC